MRKITLTALFICLIGTQLSFSQKIDRKKLLSSVNESFKGQAELLIKGKIIEMSTSDEDGKYRKDRVNYYDLDAKSIYYDQENGMIVVNCYTGDCVERVLYKQKIKRFYKRLSIPVKLEKDQIEDVIAKLEQVIE